MEAFNPSCLDDQNSSDPFVVDEGGFPGIMIVEFYGTTAALRTDNGTRGDVWSPGSFGLPDSASAQQSEVSNIHIGHGRDTSPHAQCVFRGLVILFLLMMSFW